MKLRGTTIIALFFILLYLTSCSADNSKNIEFVSDETQHDQSDNIENLNWYSEYSIETSMICIYHEGNSFSTPIEIASKDAIDQIIDTLNFSEWKPIPLEEEISASPYYYIDLNNGTVISILYDTAQVAVGKSMSIVKDNSENIEVQKLNESSGKYLADDDLLSIIKPIVEEQHY